VTGARPPIPVEQRRARLGIRHRLAASCRADAVESVAADLVALHSTDPTSVYLSAAARLADPSVGAIDRALYEDRTVVRILGMRRTVFVVSDDLVPIVHSACTERIAADERKRFVAMLEAAGIAKTGGRWLRRVEEATMRALEARGEATASEVTADVPELALRIPVGEGKTWAGEIGVNTRVLFLLATDERIVRGRPKGSWTSSQHRWAPTSTWLGEQQGERLHADDARAELARRWLAACGPALPSDLQWWTGWNKGQTTKALAALGVVDVDLDGADGVVLPDDLDPVDPPEPWVALLPCLDPTAMGWKHRDWYLGEHKDALFDRSGNVGPTVWCDGRIVGGWTQRADGEIAFRLLEDIGRSAVGAVEREAARLASFVGEIRFKPRFPTPLERELRG
jgi:hypothetical protein